MAKYADIISASKDQKEAKALQLEAKNANLNIQKAILDAEAEVELAKGALEVAKGYVPFDVEEIIIAGRKVKHAEEDLTELKAIQTELF